MRSKTQQQGEIVIDHLNSPGISLEWAAARGVSGPIVGAGKKFESGLRNCAHCSGTVLLNPQRTREREWCWACDALLCDNCGLLKKLGAPHKPYRQVLGELFDELNKGVSEL